MRTSGPFGAKNIEIYGVSARTRGEGLSQCGQGEKSIFREFLRTFFMDGS